MGYFSNGQGSGLDRTMSDAIEDYRCDCHDSEQEHLRWQADEASYWKAYFGGAIKANAESERFYREEGIDISDPDALRRLKR